PGAAAQRFSPRPLLGAGELVERGIAGDDYPLLGGQRRLPWGVRDHLAHELDVVARLHARLIRREPGEAVELRHPARHDEAVVGIQVWLVGMARTDVVGEGAGV